MKMIRKKVIAQSNLPSRLPLNTTILFWLLLDRLNAPGWAWGALFTVVGLAWVAALIAMWKNEDVDLFAEQVAHD